jgi:FkbM family methyltransferase
MLEQLSFRARLTQGAHLFKAIFRQHHGELAPLLARYVPKDGVVFDVGAHAGQFAKLFAKLAPQGHVYAFEPGSYALSILTKVRKLHGLKNVSIHKVGLSDASAVASLSIPIKASGSIGFGLSTLATPASDSDALKEKISLTTLDQFVADNKIVRLDFIKADIEGWEMRMLLGSRNSLEKLRPVLMLEADDVWLQRAGNSRKELLDFLARLDYGIFAIDHNGSVSPAGPETPNILCIPAEKAAR